MVYRKGVFLGGKRSWHCGNHKLEVVNSYKYFGFYFTTELSLTSEVTDSNSKIRTSQLLKCLLKLSDSIPTEGFFFKIYEIQIVPILLCGSEVCGYQGFNVLEKVHLAEVFLGVGMNTFNKIVYGDLDRFPACILS